MKEDKRKAHRKEFDKEISFHFESDLFFANSVDISETGIQIETPYPINVTLFIKEEDGNVQEHKGQLVWTHTKKDGDMSYGLSLQKDE